MLDAFPAAPGPPADRARGLVNRLYPSDFYHSLSIEGYRVSEELVERVRSDLWRPETDAADCESRDALEAASVENNIELYAQLTGAQVRQAMTLTRKDCGILSQSFALAAWLSVP